MASKTMLDLVKEANCRLLFSALDEIEGNKSLVWGDEDMIKLANLFVGGRQLKTLVQEMLSLYKPKAPSTPNVVYFLHSTIEAVDKLIDHMQRINTSNACNYVFFVPDVWFVARERLMENTAIYSRIEWVRSLPLRWLPSPAGIASLNLPDLHSRVLLNGDWTYLHKCALAVDQLESWCRHPIPIFASGKWSEEVLNMFAKMRNNGPGRTSNPAGLGLNRIVMVDRWLDVLTPMLIQQTYAGLLAEQYGFRLNGSISVDQAEYEQKALPQPGKMDIHLFDEVFDKVKNAHRDCFAQEISPVLKELREFKEIDREKMSVAEIKKIVAMLDGHNQKKMLADRHMRLAEMLTPPFRDKLFDIILIEQGEKTHSFIEELIIAAGPINDALRLISLQSTCSGGLKTAVMNAYDKMIFHSYGSSGMNQMLKLKKIGLIREKSSSRMQCTDYPALQWTSAKRTRRVLVEDSDLPANEPQIPYRGYIPLLVRIIEEGFSVNFATWKSNGVSNRLPPHGTVILVLGGVTAGESAALQRNPDISLVAASDLTDGHRLINHLTNIVD
ncbi:unnamed protein product, partial [Mesorhabditis spiculigera]